MAVKVNGELVEDERFYRAFLHLAEGRTPQQVQQQSASKFQRLLQLADQTVIRSVLLQQFAANEGLTVTAGEVEDARKFTWRSLASQSCGAERSEDVFRNLLVQKAERHLARHLQRPGRREVEEMYRANATAFTLPERWLASHIVRFAEDENERRSATETLTVALEELKRGKAFASVAERYSDCKDNGGSLGWISHGSMVVEFETKMVSLQLRKVSDIFATPFGLHIAIVQDHKLAGLQPIDEVRADLARRIFEDRRRTEIDHVVAKLFRSAIIETLQESQPKASSGERTR